MLEKLILTWAFIVCMIVVVVFIKERGCSEKKWIILLRSVWYSTFVIILIVINIPCFIGKTNELKLLYCLYSKSHVIYTLFANISCTFGAYHVEKLFSKKGIYSTSQIRNRYKKYMSNAIELYIIGNDLSFLNNEEQPYQKKRILELKQHCKILCQEAESKEIHLLYKELANSGVDIRTYNYTSDNSLINMKGQIKISSDGISGLFCSKKENYMQKNRIIKWLEDIRNKPLWITQDKFEMIEVDKWFECDALKEAFLRRHEEANKPIIRCIALDLGGVFFDGDMYTTFFDVLRKDMDIDIEISYDTKLVMTEINKGEDTIIDYVERHGWRLKHDRALKELTVDERKKIDEARRILESFHSRKDTILKLFEENEKLEEKLRNKGIDEEILKNEEKLDEYFKNNKVDDELIQDRKKFKEHLEKEGVSREILENSYFVNEDKINWGDLLDYLKLVATHKQILLKPNEIEDIETLWKKIWTPNKAIKSLMIELSKAGYRICPFSNLDRINGENYKKRGDFNGFAQHFYFSYTYNLLKPDEKFFEELEKGEQLSPSEILLIDDSQENIDIARKRGWHTIRYENRSSIIELINELKKLYVYDI